MTSKRTVHKDDKTSSDVKYWEYDGFRNDFCLGDGIFYIFMKKNYVKNFVK